jgi:hypothetical protein
MARWCWLNDSDLSNCRSDIKKRREIALVGEVRKRRKASVTENLLTAPYRAKTAVDSRSEQSARRNTFDPKE